MLEQRRKLSGPVGKLPQSKEIGECFAACEMKGK